MPARRAIEESPDSKDARCAIMRRCVAAFGKGRQRQFAAELPVRGGVSESLVSQWLSGKSDFGWPELHAAIALVAARHPEALPAVLLLIGEDVGCPVRVELVDPDDSDDGDYLTEVAEDERDDAEMTEAVIRGDADAVREVGGRAIENTHRRMNAALREIEKRSAPKLRAVGGGR